MDDNNYYKIYSRKENRTDARFENDEEKKIINKKQNKEI